MHQKSIHSLVLCLAMVGDVKHLQLRQTTTNNSCTYHSFGHCGIHETFTRSIPINRSMEVHQTNELMERTGTKTIILNVD